LVLWGGWQTFYVKGQGGNSSGIKGFLILLPLPLSPLSFSLFLPLLPFFITL
jgi:hypothetical protein